FIPVDRVKDNNVYPAQKVDSEAGTYEAEGIPAREDAVSVVVLDPPPGTDKLGLAYRPTNTPLPRTRTGNNAVDIDIPRDPERRGGGGGRNGGGRFGGRNGGRPGAGDEAPAKADATPAKEGPAKEEPAPAKANPTPAKADEPAATKSEK